MACFIVPTAEAIIVTAVNHGVKAKEKKDPTFSIGSDEEILKSTSDGKIPLSRKLSWLSNLLWGGSALLAFEHVWHGELVPWFPFLSAASNPAEASEMLHEMATSGVMMAVLVTAVWGVMVGVTASIVRRKSSANSTN